MTAAIGGTDAEGAWDWKSAYDACEVAQILFLRRFGPAIFSRGARSRSLALIERVSALMPTHTRRSETSQALQQYSTPAGLSFVAVVAASIGVGETVLEPSAGTGMLAIQAELAGAKLVLNELAEGRQRCCRTCSRAWLSADMTPRRLMIACPFRHARVSS